MKALVLLVFSLSTCLAKEALLDTSMTGTMQVLEAEQRDIDAIVALRNGVLEGIYKLKVHALNSEIIILNPKNIKEKNDKLIRIKKSIDEDFWSGEENGFIMFGLRKSDEKYQGFFNTNYTSYLIFGLNDQRVAIIKTSDNFHCGTGK